MRRLVAGAELDALGAKVAMLASEVEETERRRAKEEAARRELEASAKKLADALAAAQATQGSLERELAARPLTPDDDIETALAPLRLEIEQRTREQEEVQKNVAKKENERRDAVAKLAKAQAAQESLEKKLHETESKLAQVQQSAREVTSLREANARLEKRCAELDAAATGAGDHAKQREKHFKDLVANRDARIADLEARLVEALTEKEPPAIELVLREREALVEELALALASCRNAAPSLRPG